MSTATLTQSSPLQTESMPPKSNPGKTSRSDRSPAKPSTAPAVPPQRTAAPLVLPGVERIVLTGFMGSGKTSAGSLLAQRLGWRFLDLDQEIEARHHRTVPQIFSESGETHFRHLESLALASLLGQQQVVIALGGGAPEELGNRLLLEQTPRTKVIYLSASFDTLLARCAAQAADPSATARPNLADLALAQRRYHQRHPHYQRIATHTIHTAELTPAQVADAIFTTLLTAAPLNARQGSL
ncbi:MAG: shikimate kinase [Acidobacteriaceae bacterium]